MQDVVGARAAQREKFAFEAEQHSLLSGGAIEVRIVWGDNTLFVRQIDPVRGFVIGDGTSGQPVDFVVPGELLGSGRVSLISADSTGAYLKLPRLATGVVRIMDEEAQSVEGLRDNLPLSSAGARHLCLQLGTRAELLVGALRIEVDCVVPERATARSFIGDAWTTTLPFFGASLLSVASLLGAMAYLMPPLGVTDGAALSRDQLVLMQAYLEASAEREEDERLDPSGATDEPAGGQEGAKAAGEEGAMGKTTAPPKNARAARKGPKDNPDPQPSLLAEAASFGMIGILRGGVADPDSLTAPWARDDALGNAELSAQGNMWGDTIADAAGANGLGLSSLGVGGGGRHLGIGLGDIGTWGSTGNCLPGQNCTGFGNGGVGRSWGRSGLVHKPTAPGPLRPGKVKVSGRVPAEVIQRIVRQNFGRFRHCYQQGLAKNPNLQGRVVIRFLISSNGSVAQAGNGGSGLSDSSVVSCVVRSFYGLSFPKPEGGTVSVTYPLTFSPS